MEYSDEVFMRRAIDLAFLGAGKVSPNPMVGAVLVYKNRIIGEGFHQSYGAAHAEVNAVAHVAEQDQPLISQSTLYVTLEPCCIFGKTPPCTNLILQHNIPRVVIGVLDQSDAMNGKSIAILEAAGIAVTVGVLAEEAARASVLHHTLSVKNRPYTILKFAKTPDNVMGHPEKQVWISNNYAKRLAHKWRNEVDAILVGTQTAILDNPALTNRLYFGKQPLRLVLDRTLRIPQSAQLFDQTTPTVVFTEATSTPPDHPNLRYIPIDFSAIPNSIFEYLSSQKINVLMVEGGAQLLDTFIAANLWDEARIFTGNQQITDGIPAPAIPVNAAATYPIAQDRLAIYYNH
jgi:diaminohydroxyphosphoribosylaminopyrimidine deaminase/5-amino-6-(5-phosphoribosylamino)uracil reductase